MYYQSHFFLIQYRHLREYLFTIMNGTCQLAAIAGVTILVPYHVIMSLPPI